jgi:outer membrane receptor protein involved in Fe transport
LRTVWILVALSLAAVPAPGQFAFAELSGTVVAPDGTRLSRVAVTARDPATGLRRSATTTDAGTYVIAGLKPGTYLVTFKLSGFTTVESQGVELRLGQTTQLLIRLQPLALSETINVIANPQLIDVETKQIGDTLTADEFRDLPTQNRSFVLFAALVPGVVPNPQTDTSSSDALYINGQHQANNSFRVDGAKNDDPTTGSIAGAQVRTAIEAIQEFQVLTSQYDAEFGGATGGVLNAITKSGTNAVKGSAFVFSQQAKWNAKDFFTERANLPRPRASFLSTGFTFGGPILRDRLHYFVSFEGIRDKEGHSRSFTGRPELAYSTTEDNKVRNVLLRADYQFARNLHSSLRYLTESAPQLNKIVGAQTVLEGAREEHDSDLNAIGSLESVAAENQFNSLRVSHTHEHFINAASPFGRWARDFNRLRALGPLLDRPSIDEGPSAFGQDQTADSIDLADTAYWLVRTHEIRAGVQWARRAMDSSNFTNANGRFEFDTDRAFDANDITTYPVAFNIRIHGSARAESLKNDTLGLFVQDEWRIRDNLMLTAGLRWDRDDAVADRNNFAPRLGFAWSPRSARTVIRGGFGRFYDSMRLNLWSQQVLDALRLTDGIALRIPDAGTNRQFFFDLARTNRLTSLLELRDFLARTLEEQTGGQLNLNPTVDHRGRVQPYVDTATLGAQRELSSTVALGVDLVYSESNKTSVVVDLNPFSRSRGGRPNISILDGKVVRMGSISTPVNAGHNRYSAVQLSLRKRMRGSSGGRISYTYSRSMGNYGNAGPLGAPNTAYFQTRSETGYNFDTGEIIGDPLRLNLDDPRNDGQPAGWHRRHNLVLAGVWRVPRTSWRGSAGLSFSWVYRYLSGDMFTMLTNDLLDNGNRASAAAGSYSASTPSDIAQDDVRFDGTMFGAENPDFSRLDLSLRYSIALPNREAELSLIGEVFNVSNRTNFVNAGGAIAGTAGFLTPTAAFTPRQFQLGARVTF